MLGVYITYVLNRCRRIRTFKVKYVLDLYADRTGRLFRNYAMAALDLYAGRIGRLFSWRTLTSSATYTDTTCMRLIAELRT